MIIKPIAKCPVCTEKLGYISKGEICSFICQDCKFIYTWGYDGILRPPVKLEEKKSKKCRCASCQSRDET